MPDEGDRLPPTSRALRRFLRYVWPHRRLAVMAATVSTVRTAGLLCLPLLARYAVDHLLLDDATSIDERLDVLKLAAVPLGALIAVLLVSQYYKTMITGTLSLRIILDLRQALFDHIQRLGLGFFERRRTGAIISRLMEDVNLAQSFVTTAITTIVVDSLSAVAVVALLFALDWRLAALSLVALPIVAVQLRFFRGRVRSTSRAAQEQRASVIANYHERLTGILLVLSHHAFLREARRGFVTLHRAFRTRLRHMHWIALFQVCIGFLSQCLPLLIFWYGAWRIISAPETGDTLTLGSLVAFMAYLGWLLGPLGRFAELNNSVNSAMAGLERVFEVFDVEPGVGDPDEPVALPKPVRGELRLEGVGFSYTADRPALEGIDLEIAPGTSLALVGPSGHGKTTLVKLLARFYDVDRGRILLDGVDVRDVALADLRASMGFVSQEIVVFSGSVRENIAYGSPLPARRVAEEDIVAAAKAAQAWEFIERLPDGLDTSIGERGVRLSAGQRQRIALARLFLRDPRILLLDEPTSALDSVSEALIQQALETLMKDRTSVVVAHRLSTIRNAHRIGVVREGRIVELGTHDELLRHGGVYAELHDKQQLLETDNLRNDQYDGDLAASEELPTDEDADLDNRGW